MSRRLAILLLRLYPPAFLRRYGPELQALIEDSEPGPAEVLDIVRGALGQRLTARPTRWLFGGWVVLVLAGGSFAKTTEDGGFSLAGRTHMVLGGAHLAVELLAWVTTAVLGLSLAAALTGAPMDGRRLSRIAAAGMAGIATASGVYTAALAIDAGGLGALPNGPSGAFGSVELSLVLGTAAMALAAAVAVAAAGSGAVGARSGADGGAGAAAGGGGSAQSP